MSIRNRVSWSLAMLALMSMGGLLEGCKSEGNGNGNNDAGTPNINVFPTTGLQTTEQTGPGHTTTFQVVLSSAPTAEVTIPISSSDTSEGTVSTTALVFTAATWAAPQTVTVTGVQDDEADGDQTYTIITAPATSNDPTYAGVNPADVTVKSVDSDSAGIRAIETANLMTTEMGGMASFKVVLNTKPTADVTVPIVSRDPGEVAVVNASQSVTFTSSNWNVPQTVQLRGVQDDEADGEVEVTISTDGATSADTRYAGKKFDDFKVKNIDDDSAGFLIEPLTGLQTSEDADTDSFSVRLLTQPTADVILPLSSATPLEVSIDKPSLTFTTNNWASPQTVTVTGINDDVADTDTGFEIATAPAMSADGRYQDKNPPNIFGTNADNDSPGFSLSGTESLVVSESGTSDTFFVRLRTRPSSTVTLTLSTDPASEAIASPTTLEFTIDNWSSPHPVLVTGIDDNVEDPDQTFLVKFEGATGDALYAGTKPGDVAGINEDNDSPAVRVRPDAQFETSESGSVATYTVEVQTRPEVGQDITVPITFDVPGEVEAIPSSLVFKNDDWSPKTVTFRGLNDDLADGNPLVTATFGPPTGNTRYATLPAIQRKGTNFDNDSASLAVLFEGSDRYTTEAGGQFRFWVYLRSAPTQPVTFEVKVSKDGEARTLTPSVSFSTTDWTSPKEVLIEGVDDNVLDGDPDYTVSVGPGNAAEYQGVSLIPPIALKNRDNDSANVRVIQDLQGSNPTLVTTEDGGAARFRLVLDTKPTAEIRIPVVSRDITRGTVDTSLIRIQPDDWNAVNWVTITGQNDAEPIDDGNHTYYIGLGPVVAEDPVADANYNGFVLGDITVVNVDNDSAALLVTSEQPKLQVTETGATPKWIEVRLQTQPTATVTVPIRPVPASEARVDLAALTFNTTDWFIPKRVNVYGVPDATQDGKQDFTIEIGRRVTDPASGDAAYDALAPRTVPGENYDVDTPDILVSYNGELKTSEDTATQTVFSIELVSKPATGTTVTVPLTVLRTDPGKPAPQDRLEGRIISPAAVLGVHSVTFDEFNYASPRQVVLEGINDDIADGDVEYFVRVGPAMSADTRYAGRSIPNIKVENADNDTADLVIGNIAPTVDNRLALGEPTAPGSFTVRLQTQPISTVTVSFSTSRTVGQTPEVSLGGSIKFGPVAVPLDGIYAWDSAQTVNVTTVNDDIQDGPVSFDIRVDATSDDPNYVTQAATPVAKRKLVPVTVADDGDTAGLVISNTTGFSVTEPAGFENFTVRLRSQPTADVVVPITSTDLTEGVITAVNVVPPITATTITNGVQLTIPAGSWSQATTLRLTAQQDNTIDLNSSYSVSVGATTSTDTKYNLSAQTIPAETVDGDTAGINYDNVDNSLLPPAVAFTTTEEAPGNPQTIRLVLNSKPSDQVTVGVRLAGADPDEATLSTNMLTFTVDDWNDPTKHVVTVTGANDLIDDGTRNYTVVFDPAVSNDDDYLNVVPPNGGFLNAQNSDDADAWGISASAVSSMDVYEEGTERSVSIVLRSQPTASVSTQVTLASGGLPNYNNAAAELSLDGTTWANGATGVPVTFTTANWNTAQTIRVRGVDNNTRDFAGNTAIADQYHNIAVQFSTTVSSDANYGNKSISAIPGRVYDVPRTCNSVLELWPGSDSGVYYLDTDLAAATDAHQAYCDLDSAGGGWTLLSFSGDTNAFGGLPYPISAGAVTCFEDFAGPRDCTRGVGLPEEDLADLFANSSQLAQGQSTINLLTATAYTDLEDYDFAGIYDYSGPSGDLTLEGLVLDATDSDTATCTQLATGEFFNMPNTSPSGAADGTAVFLAQGLRSPLAGVNYSSISESYTFSVGSPIAACSIQTIPPVSYVGTWQGNQYGPQSSGGAFGSYSVWVR